MCVAQEQGQLQQVNVVGYADIDVASGAVVGTGQGRSPGRGDGTVAGTTIRGAGDRAPELPRRSPVAGEHALPRGGVRSRQRTV